MVFNSSDSPWIYNFIHLLNKKGYSVVNQFTDRGLCACGQLLWQFLFVFPSLLWLSFCLSACLSILWQLFAIYFAYLPHTRSPLKHQLHQRAEVAQVKPSLAKTEHVSPPLKQFLPLPEATPKCLFWLLLDLPLPLLHFLAFAFGFRFFISIPFLTAGAQWVIRYNCRSGGQSVAYLVHSLNFLWKKNVVACFTLMGLSTSCQAQIEL